jgi:hypothetical protein
LKKPPQKVAYLWQLGGFLSAALPAQNSPELHFRFMNLSIQSSVLKSVTSVLFYYVTLLQKFTNFVKILSELLSFIGNIIQYANEIF